MAMALRRAAAAGMVIVALLATGVPPARAAEAGKLTVFAAASLSDAFTAIGDSLRARESIDVRFNFAGSQQLVIQLEQGAGADVFASADTRWMDEAGSRGLLAGPPRLFARNRLVVIVPATNPARLASLPDLARRGLKLVLAADAVPAGRYSRQVLQKLAGRPGFGADFARRALKNVVSEEENVKAVVARVALGEADAGLVYRSDVTPAVAGKVRMLEIPDASNIVADYPIAILKGTPAGAAARAFLDFLLSTNGQRILARQGFLPVTETR